jgi:hypothetical protein
MEETATVGTSGRAMVAVALFEVMRVGVFAVVLGFFGCRRVLNCLARSPADDEEGRNQHQDHVDRDRCDQAFAAELLPESPLGTFLTQALFFLDHDRNDLFRGGRRRKFRGCGVLGIGHEHNAVDLSEPAQQKITSKSGISFPHPVTPLTFMHNQPTEHDF